MPATLNMLLLKFEIPNHNDQNSKQITKTEGVTLNPITKPISFGGAPSQAQASPGGFVFLEFVIYLEFVIWNL